MTAEFVEWLDAQLAEDKRIALGATWCEDAGTWRAEPSPYGTPARPTGPRWYIEDAMDDGVITTVDPQASPDEDVAQHIAEWDPARVLREIDAKRQLLDLHRPMRRRSTGSGGGAIEDCQICDHFPAQFPCLTLRLLALPYADRPGYREEWRPSAP
ncbi:DUF6221 family protein [Streptomyces sp. DSM 3412]|uniref:DUF6221 family protein n=1 Tax=Streptomyces gottesmaniae TaxID=3075518 RepID=A0ABU2YV54_9ACTN|nr:DUF6221 family protein [Streptomyces sp. DSM 3412]MDT0567904.1 DUF6221 family protein [Streptomyces sp. DSM 3412]